MEVQYAALVCRATVAQQLMRGRLQMLVLRQALVGRQGPEALLEDDLLEALVVVEAVPLLAQSGRDNARPRALHLGQGSGEGALGRLDARAVPHAAVGARGLDGLELQIAAIV